MVNPSLIHSNKSMHKISLIFVKMLQALFRDFYASVFLICCEQAWHPSCTKFFHIQFFMQNISYTFYWNACSLSNFTHFYLPVIQYHIVHLFVDFWCCCTFWKSFTWIIFKAGTDTFKLGSPFLNSWKRRRRVPINFYDTIYLLTATGLSPGGSTHLHTNNTQNNTNNNWTTQIQANVEECGPCPVFASFTLAFALQLRKMHGKPSVRVRELRMNFIWC